MIVAVVKPKGDAPAEQDVIDHVREHLAAYKAPRRVITVDTIGRAPKGKVDYRRLREHTTSTV